jgi:TM2 domain-containing membrane protein YozV
MMDDAMADESDSDRPAAGSPAVSVETKPCPFCGEEIKKVAVRCKHCQADLWTGAGAGAPKAAEPDFKGAQPSVAAKPMDDFEVRFLEFAYQSTAKLHVLAVAHALRLPTAEVSERLEDMAARDVLGREVDDDGNVYFTIPGRPSERAPAHPPLVGASAARSQLQPVSAPADGTAVTALVLNIIIPGSGSLIAGRTSMGVVQLVLWVVSFPLCLVLIGFPMLLAVWIWSLVSGIQILEESKRRQSSS